MELLVAVDVWEITNQFWFTIARLIVHTVLDVPVEAGGDMSLIDSAWNLMW